MKVLILGGNGYLGPHVVKALEPYYTLRVTDINDIETKHESMHIDVGSLDQVMRAAEGMDRDSQLLRPTTRSTTRV